MSVNAHRLRCMFEVIDLRRWGELPEYFSDDVCYERPGYPAIRGIEQLIHFYREIRVIEEGRHDLWKILAEDHAAACWGRFTGRAKDGRALDERFADVYQLIDGRVSVRATHFFRAAI